MPLIIIVVVHSNIVVEHYIECELMRQFALGSCEHDDAMTLSSYLDSQWLIAFIVLTQHDKKYIHCYLFHHFEAFSSRTHPVTHFMRSISFGIIIAGVYKCQQFENQFGDDAKLIELNRDEHEAKNFSTQKNKIILIFILLSEWQMNTTMRVAVADGNACMLSPTSTDKLRNYLFFHYKYSSPSNYFRMPVARSHTPDGIQSPHKITHSPTIPDYCRRAVE